MRISRSSVSLFARYFWLFSILLFASQVVYSPESSHFHVTNDAIHSADVDVTPNASVSRRAQVIERLASAPTKPPYDIVLSANTARSDTLKTLLTSTLASSYFLDRVTPIVVDVVNDRQEPRGQTSDAWVSIVASLPSDSEFLKVFVHELGHVVDLHFLVKKLFASDPSEAFYTLSWVDYDQKKKGMSINDFVSGYALTNKYEDFAESFAFYVFHNDEFKRRAIKNATLVQKYNFLATEVFANGEFQGTSFEDGVIPTYLWDTTKIPVKTNKYLFYLR